MPLGTVIKVAGVLALPWLLAPLFDPRVPVGYYERQLPVMEATLQGREVRLIVDTGAVVSYADKSYVERSEGLFVGSFVADEDISFARSTDGPRIELSIGCRDFDFQELMIYDIPRHLREKSPPVAGLLGWQQLKQLTVRIDLEEQVARCMKEETPLGQVGVESLEFAAIGQPYYDAKISNPLTGEAVNVRVLLDTGLGVGALMSKEAAERLGLELSRSSTRLDSSGLLWEADALIEIDGIQSSYRVHVQEKNRHLVERQIDLMIGTAFFEGASEIWIDRNGVVIVREP